MNAHTNIRSLHTGSLAQMVRDADIAAKIASAAIWLPDEKVAHALDVAALDLRDEVLSELARIVDVDALRRVL